MKVSKSTIYKLEIERPCGCKIAGDYEDAAYKKVRGTASFTACAKHAEDASLVEELLREVLEKEAAEAKAPEPLAPAVHPRTVAHQQAAAAPGAQPPADGPPGRTVRTAGSNGSAGQERQNRNGYGTPTISRGGAATGSNRPSPKPSGQSPFRRADPNAKLSPAAASAVAKTASAPAAVALDFELGAEAPEDPRLTRVIEGMNLFEDEGEEA